MTTPHRDEVTGTDTTGHEWDGIRELNTPLPKWWLYIIYASIVWSIAYWLVMPAWPILWTDGWTYTRGVIGYAQRQVVSDEITELEQSRAVYLQQIADTPLEDITRSPELMEVALAGAAAAFGDNCAPCHGSGAQGFKGFPNLNDDEWLWGGTLEDIHTTLLHGIRWDADDDTRLNDMPRFLLDEMLTRDQVTDVTEFVLALSGRAEDAEAATRGGEVFKTQCVSCHGADGTGNQELGAPNLADALWLYGGERADIYESVANSRSGVMPAWSGRLDPGTIKELALYVHNLGGGE